MFVEQYVLLEDLVLDYDTSNVETSVLLSYSLNVKEPTSLDKVFIHLSGSDILNLWQQTDDSNGVRKKDFKEHHSRRH